MAKSLVKAPYSTGCVPEQELFKSFCYEKNYKLTSHWKTNNKFPFNRKSLKGLLFLYIFKSKDNSKSEVSI